MANSPSSSGRLNIMSSNTRDVNCSLLDSRCLKHLHFLTGFLCVWKKCSLDYIISQSDCIFVFYSVLFQCIKLSVAHSKTSARQTKNGCTNRIWGQPRNGNSLCQKRNERNRTGMAAWFDYILFIIVLCIVWNQINFVQNVNVSVGKHWPCLVVVLYMMKTV